MAREGRPLAPAGRARDQVTTESKCGFGVGVRVEGKEV
jgi:hypothetical protein